MLRQLTKQSVCEWSLFALLAATVLWKGGKSIDATWVALGISTFMCIVSQWRVPEPGKQPGVPMFLWGGVILFAVWTIASYLHSTTQNYGLDEVFRTGAFCLLFLWVIRFSKQPSGEAYQRAVRMVIRTVGTVTLVACVVGVLVYIFQPVDRFVGTFFDSRFHTDYWPNAWAQYLLLAWPIVYFWCFRTWKFERAAPVTLVEVVCRALPIGAVLGCLLLSYSRGGLIAFGGQLLLWLLLYALATKQRLPWKRQLAVGLLVGVIAVGTFIGLNQVREQFYRVQSVTEKVTFTAAEGTSSASEREQFWGQALHLALQKPVFGWGPYSFRFTQTPLMQGVLATSDHPHNVFLKLAAERGFPAALLMLAITVYVLTFGTKNELQREWNAERDDHSHSSFGIVIIVSLGGFLAHNLIDYNVQFVGIALLFWVLLGLLAGRLPSTKEPAVKPRVARAVEYLLALLLLVTACIEGGYLVTSSMGRRAEAAGNTQEALKWYERAKGEWFSRDLHLSRAKLYAVQGELEKSEAAIADYFTQNQHDYRAEKRLGEIYRERKLYQKSAEYFDIAYQRGKYTDLSIAANVFDLLKLQLDNEGISERKDEFEMLMLAYFNAIMMNSHFIALSPNVEQYVALAELFALHYPEKAPAYEVWAAKVDHQGKVERERLRSRPPGFLW